MSSDAEHLSRSGINLNCDELAQARETDIVPQRLPDEVLIAVLSGQVHEAPDQCHADMTQARGSPSRNDRARASALVGARPPR